MKTKKCNVCGKEFEHAEWSRIEDFYNPELHKIVITFGYGSDLDFQQWTFYKCDECLCKEISSFAISPQIDEYE